MVKVKVYYKLKTFQPFLIDMEQEGCEYIHNRPIIPQTDYIYDIMKKTAPDISTPCPHGTNSTKSYNIKITKYLCVNAPYKRSTLHYCKTVLQRNQPAKLNVSISVPETLDYTLVKVKVYYKFKTFQPFLIDVEQEGCEYVRNRPIIPESDFVYNIMKKTAPDISTPCPHGNRTYTMLWWLEERYTPKSIPAGDYRVDVQFIAKDDVLIFALEAYISVRRKGVLGSMLEW
ncbi:uncharacterized protein LOC126574686 [Anopheles aquasalis]|uniref:uncharacterized protein LOC126574686 n=1 Tax=Anopheles aquasalis TaxID=42839 RepID=UPI00215A182D|nr:uncharacterized protein LOC126574686 [Anopheles aquasalis]